MKSHLLLALLVGAALFPACGRDDRKEATPPPATGSPATTAPAGVAPAETASPPGTVAVPPTAVPRPQAKPGTTSRPRGPAPSPPGVPASASTIQQSPAPEATAPAPQSKPQWREITLTAGTPLPLTLTTAVSSESAVVETSVSARLREPVSANGEVVLPEGTVVVGTVTDVERSGRVKGRAHLTIVFSHAHLEEATLPIQTHDIRFVAEATTGEDAAKIGGGAIGGAIIGGILGGGEGAAKGAAIGGAAGAGVVMMTRGKEVNLTPGTEIMATLAAPFTVTVPQR